MNQTRASAPMALDRPDLSFWQIWNMSFGFLGIQFGFALQGGFMSRIFQTLGAEKDALPLLWIAAPLTGLLVQPIIGYLSDRTWHPLLGRRRPYFLVGAILSSLALLVMPHSPALWIAAGLLWVLDASINISMEPFRALVADKLPERQRSYGFVLQTLIIGIGTWVASTLPWLVNQLGVSNEAAPGVVPPSVQVAFAIGAAVFLGAILVTVVTTKEYPPEQHVGTAVPESRGHFLAEILHDIRHMPAQMLRIGIVQFFSWLAFFSMWSMATPALTEHVFRAPAPDPSRFDMADPVQAAAFTQANAAFQSAADLVGAYMGYYGLASMVVALLLSLYAARRALDCRLVHFVSLLAGGLGFLSMMFVGDHPVWLIGSFCLVGVAWASILSMPYALLAGSLAPGKMGGYMGIFNMFIVIPMLLQMLTLPLFYDAWLGGQPENVIRLAGVLLAAAAVAVLRVPAASVKP